MLLNPSEQSSKPVAGYDGLCDHVRLDGGFIAQVLVDHIALRVGARFFLRQLFHLDQSLHE